MHLLVVAMGFPSPESPYRAAFIGEQVRQLCARVDRITVLSPTAFVPSFMRRFRRGGVLASLPDRYQLLEGCCEVLFPRYFKAPDNFFLSWTTARWTTAQWCRIVYQTVARFAKTCPVSIIHAHIGSVSSWAAVYAAQRHHIPCVVTYHGTDVHTILAQRRKGWRLCRDSFRFADLNLPVSHSLENILRRHAQPIGRCETLLLGVDQTRFYPPPEPCAEPRALFVGRVERAKGIFDLLSAWVKVRLACPDALLSIVGPDYTDGKFVQRVRSCGVESSIELTGPLPNPAIADLMRQSRLFCLPSHQEGTPVCVMEALSSGLPVVATRVGGIPAIVHDEKTGLLVDKGDVEGLAAALATLLRHPDRCARMGQVARTFAREHLDARKTADRLVAFYSKLIAAHSRMQSC